MHAETAGCQLGQSLDVTAIQLAGHRHFLEFFSHTISYPSRPTRGMAYLRM
jgi:hypothetical protein